MSLAFRSSRFQPSFGSDPGSVPPFWLQAPAGVAMGFRHMAAVAVVHVLIGGSYGRGHLRRSSHRYLE